MFDARAWRVKRARRALPRHGSCFGTRDRKEADMDAKATVSEIMQPAPMTVRADDGLDMIADPLVEAAGVVVGSDHLVLEPSDAVQQPCRRIARRVEFEIRQHLPHDGGLIAVVIDRVVLSESHRLGPLSQQPGAEAVKRADPQAGTGQQVLDAGGHLGGGLVREGNRQNLPGIDALLDQPCDASGDDAGLARSGTGENEQRAFVMLDGGALAGSQIGHEQMISRGLRHRRMSRFGSDPVGPAGAQPVEKESVSRRLYAERRRFGTVG